MRQSPLATRSRHCIDPSAEDVRRGEESVQELLDVLNDAGSRAILEATSETALSANEVSEVCDLPLSTTYRKLELLTEVGLVEERTRVRRSGKHPNEYIRSVSNVMVSLDGTEGTELRISHRTSPGNAESAVPGMSD